MFGGFYTAASGVLTQQRIINVLTNNIANAKTTGFRAERVVSETFDFELMTRIEKGNTQVIGRGSPIRVVRDVPVDLNNSSLEQTGRPFDMAISGFGYFNIAVAARQDGEGNETAPAQTRLTRNGCFDIDEEGYLILPNVGRVLGEKGEIKVEGSYFSVSERGVVYDNRGRRVDRLLITNPNEEAQLDKVVDGQYTVDNPELNTEVPLTQVHVYQGVLEKPNIDINREYTLVMEAQRAFQTCSQAIKIVDSMNQKAATQIAAL